MIRPLLPWSLALLAFVALGFASASAPSDSRVELLSADRDFILYVDYKQTSGDLRRAWVSLRPAHPDARPPWRGALSGVHLAMRGQRTVPPGSRILMNRRSDGSYLGWGLVPAARRIERLLLRGEDGRLVAFRVPEVTAQGGDDDPPPQDPPDDPPPEEDPPGDDEACSIPSGCEIINPWTCECEGGLRDPWGKDAVMTRPDQLAIGF